MLIAMYIDSLWFSSHNDYYKFMHNDYYKYVVNMLFIHIDMVYVGHAK